MGRINPGQVGSPKAHYAIEKCLRTENGRYQQGQAVRCSIEEDARKDDGRRGDENPQELSLLDKIDNDKSKRQAARERPQFLNHVHTAHCLLHLPRRELLGGHQARNNPGRVLKCTKRQGEAARHH